MRSRSSSYTGIRVCPSSASSSMTCSGLGVEGTPTTRVRGTMISFAVRSAKAKSPCTSSAEGAPGAPPRASSLRIRSISCSGRRRRRVAGGGALAKQERVEEAQHHAHREAEQGQTKQRRAGEAEAPGERVRGRQRARSGDRWSAPTRRRAGPRPAAACSANWHGRRRGRARRPPRWRRPPPRRPAARTRRPAGRPRVGSGSLLQLQEPARPVRVAGARPRGSRPRRRPAARLPRPAAARALRERRPPREARASAGS